jgi:hypothetical protein
MRELNRRVAQARSRRATPGELRDARERYKELQEELRRLELAPETRQGEDRLDRYERAQRLQALREEFQATAENPLQEPRNSMFLALIMTVASFLLCSFGAGGTYFALLLISQKPTAQSTADGFWQAVINRDYQTAHDNYFAPVLRVQLTSDQFVQEANATDALFGPIVSAVLSKQSGDQQTVAQLTYSVERTNSTTGKTVSYPVTLSLATHQGSWGITDMGATIVPTAAGVPAPPATPTPAHTPAHGTPSPTGSTGPGAGPDLLAEQRGFVLDGA